ncbi:hypothetical protein PGT21_034064 [Puccinia graminis f. sp. tritici]|uniref:Uncharacterized protein n=1 Tax=Puccinia graminis f. sp. tritici TaxID=56615 RepID=A0A5B0LZ87_PUCGR|nr:hypothetical protein PGT21_034064 [Puccinia graminis f. sp. tritici]
MILEGMRSGRPDPADQNIHVGRLSTLMWIALDFYVGGGRIELCAQPYRVHERPRRRLDFPSRHPLHLQKRLQKRHQTIAMQLAVHIVMQLAVQATSDINNTFASCSSDINNTFASCSSL